MSDFKREVVPSMLRRCVGLDYYKSNIYMITLVVAQRKPLLGTLVDDVNNPRVELTPLGREIASHEVVKIEQFYPMIEVWKTCIMPDHIHLIINVKDNLPCGRHLGRVVRSFKSGCTRAWAQLRGDLAVKAASTLLKDSKAAGTHQNSKVAGVKQGGSVRAAFTARDQTMPSLFEPGYNDKIIKQYGHVDRWRHYLDDNPRRLLTRAIAPVESLPCHNTKCHYHSQSMSHAQPAGTVHL